MVLLNERPYMRTRVVRFPSTDVRVFGPSKHRQIDRRFDTSEMSKANKICLRGTFIFALDDIVIDIDIDHSIAFDVGGRVQSVVL